MNPTELFRDQAYAEGSATQKYLYSHPNSGFVLLDLAKKFNLLDLDVYKKFAILVGDVILGIQNVADLKTLLIDELNLDEVTAEKLSVDILEFLKPLNDPTWQPPPTSTSIDETTVGMAEEILAMETDLSAIPQVRTMAPVTPEETVYTSTQAAILHEGQSADQKQTSSARWESES